MPVQLDAKARAALEAHIRFCRELGISEFYRRPAPLSLKEGPRIARDDTVQGLQADDRTHLAPQAAPWQLSIIEEAERALLPEAGIDDKAAALRALREDMGECKRCALHVGRKNVVFGCGNPAASLMFVGEAPGADEDEQGEPFVGRAGQLLTRMIEAMGLSRSDVYIANVLKSRPPGNRTPLPPEIAACSPFLFRQIAIIQPKVIVALGAVAARTLLGLNDSMANLRSRLYDFRGAKLAVTYHPAFLLRDPRRKREAWQDLQMVMDYIGLRPRPRNPDL